MLEAQLIIDSTPSIIGQVTGNFRDRLGPAWCLWEVNRYNCLTGLNRHILMVLQ